MSGNQQSLVKLPRRVTVATQSGQRSINTTQMGKLENQSSMLSFTYYRPHYCQCLIIPQGRNTSLLFSATIYPGSGGAEKDGVTTNLDQKLAMNRGNLLRGKIDDAKGVHNKLHRQTDKMGAKSSYTIENVKAKILECSQGDRHIITKRIQYTTIGSPCNSWADVVKCTNKIKEILKSQLELKS